jgi:hypothetical protein
MEFCKAMFSTEGTVSFGRVGGFLALVCSIAWVSWVVWNTKTIPELGGVALFIGTLYGLSKAGETVQKMKGADNASAPPSV